MNQSLDLALVKFWKNIIPPQPALVAVSGGPDSLALLHALLLQKPRFPTLRLEVAHFNHHIRGVAADLDARFVEEFCRQHDLPFHLGQLDVPAFAAAHNLSPEDAARQARYTWLSDLAARQDISLVLTGHTADDQAETVLLRLLRGTGPHGLAGMNSFSPLPPPHPALIAEYSKAESKEVWLGRPLLTVWRRDIEAYVLENNLAPRQDETNASPDYARNRVRQRLLPLLESEYQPQIKANLVRLAELARQDEEWLYYVVQGELGKISRFEFGCQLVFDKEKFLKNPVGLQKRLVRQAARILGDLHNFEASHIEAILALFAEEESRRLDLPGKLVAFTGKNRAGMLAVPDPANWPASGLAIPVPGTLSGPGGRWQIQAHLVNNTNSADFPRKDGASPSNVYQGNAYQVWLDYAKISHHLEASSSAQPTVRPRREGERYRPLGAPGQRKVQDIMLDAGIPRELRRDWPVIVSPGTTQQPEAICWIPGGPIAHAFRVTPETEQILGLKFDFGSTPQSTRFHEAQADHLNRLAYRDEPDDWLESNKSGKE
jgi:tRNA(Ile)-lysidine synthase